MPSAEGNGPACDGSDHEGGAGEIDVALMCRGIPPVAEGGIEECGEEDHVCQRNYVEGFRVATKGIELASVAQQHIRGRKDSENDHQSAQEDTGDPEAAMNIRAPGGHERGLGNQQKDPDSEYRTVNVNDKAWQWCAENSGKEIGARKTHQHCKEHEQGTGGKEVMIITAAGQARCWTRGCNRLSCDGCQGASVNCEGPNAWELGELYTEFESSAHGKIGSEKALCKLDTDKKRR